MSENNMFMFKLNRNFFYCKKWFYENFQKKHSIYTTYNQSKIIKIQLFLLMFKLMNFFSFLSLNIFFFFFVISVKSSLFIKIEPAKQQIMCLECYWYVDIYTVVLSYSNTTTCQNRTTTKHKLGYVQNEYIAQIDI